MKKDQNNGEFLKNLSLLSIPFFLVVAPILGYFLGYWLDKQLKTAPYLAYFFLFLGIVAAIREIYRLVKEIKDDDQPRD